MRLAVCLMVSGALLAACGDDADPGGAEGSSGDVESSSSTGGPDSASTITETTTPSTTSSTTTTSTTQPDGTDSSSTAGDDASSSGPGADTSSGGCPLGQIGCACDDGACDDGYQCVMDVCVEELDCMDDEWGDNVTEDSAHFLGEISDDDDDGGTVMGVLTGPDDVDWFRYDGSDESFSTIDPFRTVVSSAGVRFCKFASCPGEDGIADTNFDCQDDAIATTSPDGRPGCCADSLIHVPDASCGSTSINDDSMAVWVRIDQPAEACVTYAFDYHF